MLRVCCGECGGSLQLRVACHKIFGVPMAITAKDRTAGGILTFDHAETQGFYFFLGLCTSLKYPQYVGPITEFQFRYNNRMNEDIFGTAIEGC